MRLHHTEAHFDAYGGKAINLSVEGAITTYSSTDSLCGWSGGSATFSIPRCDGLIPVPIPDAVMTCGGPVPGVGGSSAVTGCL